MKPTPKFLALLVAVGFAWRMVIVWRTPMPREDGVNYLWMAERFAAGAGCEALGEIFSPLLALVIAVPIVLGIEPFFAGQLMLALVGACVVVPVVKIAEELRPGTGWIAGLLSVVAFRSVLVGAWIYTEPLFLLVASTSFLFGLRNRFWWCGVFGGLAFWIRPEAVVVPGVFVLVDRRAWRVVIPVTIAVLLLALVRGQCGHGYDPVPKLRFILDNNVAKDVSGLARLGQIPVRILEAFGAVALLAVVGAFRFRPKPVMWLLLFATLIIWAYVPRWRFFVNWMFVVVPLAAAAVERLPKRGGWIGGVVALVLVLDCVLAATGGSKANRIVERQVGEYLATLAKDGEEITGDMTRVLYFAGRRPLPPRHFSVDELVATGRSARFVVLRERIADEVAAGLPGHVPLVLPEGMGRLAAERGMRVLERR